MTGEGVCGLVVGPLGGEVVRHDACSKTLQLRIFNFVKSMGVQDRDQGFMVRDNRKVANASKKNVALCPSNS